MLLCDYKVLLLTYLFAHTLNLGTFMGTLFGRYQLTEQDQCAERKFLVLTTAKSRVKSSHTSMFSCPVQESANAKWRCDPKDP